jgi:tRNA synthetases class I (I, L, M and V)
MVHTPILPKKINWSDAINLRMWYDINNKYNQIQSVFVNQIIHWSLTEDSVKPLVYSDFFSRFYNKNVILPLFVAPYSFSSQHNKINVFLSSYEESYEKIKSTLSSLSVNVDIYNSFSNRVIDSLYSCDTVLHKDHRIGLRSDVVYYNIVEGKVVPDHRIEIKNATKSLYTIRFFLNSTKDTVLWDLYHPFYLFGCVALLINPHDKRYKKIRWKEIILPITNKQVPIIPYEWVSIEWHGTRVLVPAHNREDFQIAIELWLPLDVYAFDKNGIFTTEAKDFANKSLQDFSENVIKYIDDISNLDQIQSIIVDEYRDKNDWTLLFPILEKNIYIGLWYRDFDDTSFISDYQIHWDIDNLKNDIITDEFFCISNQDELQPIITSLWWYLESNSYLSQENFTVSNLLQDIICDFFIFRLFDFPVKGDQIIDVLSSKLWWEFLRKSFYHYRTSYTDKIYEEKHDIFTLLSHITDTDSVSIEDINSLLSYIDTNSYFIHTKNGYTMTASYRYHYDNEYVGLSSLLSQSENSQNFSLFYNKDNYKYVKYFMYLYSYIYKKPLSVELFALSESSHLSWVQWDVLQKSASPDALRLFLLQYVVINPSEEIVTSYTLDQLDRFIQKRWNLSRIIPLYDLSLMWLQTKIIEKKLELTDYDSYLITKLHELYDEVVFLQSKQCVSQSLCLVVSTLRNEIWDLLLYILKKTPSPVTELVVVYVILFANHILYPFMPTSVLAFLQWSWYILEEDFFVRETSSFVEKNYKCNLMLHILSQWYQKIINSDYIHGFILQANKDFLDYFKDSYSQFIDFIGHEYIIRYLEESDIWPEDIESHKIFTMQRWIIESQKEITQTLPSLSILQWQLQYKQQLLQTMKNTIVRMRTTGQLDKIQQFQNQIDTLLKEIANLEYQISKLKYF